MAGRNETGEKKPPVRNRTNPVQGGQPPPPNRRVRRYWAILFWLTFVIIIYGLFLFNRQTISDSIAIIRNERMARENESIPAPVPPPLPVVPPPIPQALPPAADLPPVPQAVLPQAVLPQAVLPPAEYHPQPVLPPAEDPPLPGQAELRERALYFIQVDRSGSIFRIRVNRNIPLSVTPMTDVLHALIDGPNEDESRRGLISLIPPGSQLLSATVREGTAYLNFSEDFQYNPYGVEGYVGQLRQIVYTVTEFPHITGVQILVDGRRLDFMGYGIWVGSPLRRGAI